VRKRIIIGLLAAAVIGVVVFLISGPKRGTVEWYKREYLAELNRLHGRESLVKRFVRGIYEWTGIGQPIGQTERGVVAQENALIKLGYLERREFIITNLPIGNAVEVIGREAATAIPGLCRITTGEKTNAVVVTAVREDMPKWDELIRKLDVPETGK
jgi:hypothetical protein